MATLRKLYSYPRFRGTCYGLAETKDAFLRQMFGREPHGHERKQGKLANWPGSKRIAAFIATLPPGTLIATDDDFKLRFFLYNREAQRDNKTYLPCMHFSVAVSGDFIRCYACDATTPLNLEGAVWKPRK